MFYTNLQHRISEEFKRLTGVSKETFAVMLECLQNGLSRRGRPPRLTLEDRLLMTLMYWREYRTLAHIGATYGVSEACVCRTVKHFENLLIQDKRFHLPGKRVLLEPNADFEIVLVDATECPCERPKKDSVGTIRAKRSAIPKKRRLFATKRRARLSPRPFVKAKRVTSRSSNRATRFCR